MPTQCVTAVLSESNAYFQGSWTNYDSNSTYNSAMVGSRFSSDIFIWRPAPTFFKLGRISALWLFTIVQAVRDQVRKKLF